MVGKRNDTIDAYRGLAVAGVMAYHYTQSRADDFAGVPAYSTWFALGEFGVHLFFVISGLVITMTLAQSRDVLDFATKRIARLWPVFIVACTLTAGAMWLVGPPAFRVGPIDYLLNLTMIPGKLGAKMVDGVYWSLVPELRFYVWVGLAYVALRQRFWLGFVALAWAAFALSLVTPGIADAVFGARQNAFFLVGMGAYYWLFVKDQRAAWVCGLSGVAMYVLLGDAQISSERLPPGLVLIILAAVVGSMIVLLWWGRARQWGPLAWLGRISYSLYLVHNRLGVTLIQHLKGWGLPDLAAIAVGASAMILLAWGLFELVERPGQRKALKFLTASRLALTRRTALA